MTSNLKAIASHVLTAAVTLTLAVLLLGGRRHAGPEPIFYEAPKAAAATTEPSPSGRRAAGPGAAGRRRLGG